MNAVPHEFPLHPVHINALPQLAKFCGGSLERTKVIRLYDLGPAPPGHESSQGLQNSCRGHLRNQLLMHGTSHHASDQTHVPRRRGLPSHSDVQWSGEVESIELLRGGTPDIHV
ncbi:hypothetical protein T12_12636 [Trichinella patagoniensis]|uniref:Uncharacterized protein n=1 Tax=Trichinella patagoniensis TaxID=990121 RepID=A0A0V0YV81_9BILA|nr:hypothetical protein T12_12636 [Trichinella patagoniensis]